MAKRKRLTPANPDYVARSAHSPAPENTAGTDLPGPMHMAPIAAVAGDAAATAALADLTDQMALARREGRLVLELALDQVDAAYLIRDRTLVDEEEMQVLMESLRLRGQQTPIEVAPLQDGRYGLISGWRRLEALRRLHAESQESRFDTILGLLRHPDQAADAYLAMVEENEIRVGLSYYERARVAARAVDQGVFESEKKALQSLFRAASRAKRSKIGSFLTLVRRLDGVLRFPAALPERAGLALVRALDADPALIGRLTRRLAAQEPRNAAEEQALIKAEIAGSPGKETAPEEAISEPMPGLRLRWHANGGLTLTGPAMTPALRHALLEWLEARGS